MITVFPDGTILDFSKDDPGHVKIEHLLNSIHLENRFANNIPWTVLQHSLAVGKATEYLYEGNMTMIQFAYFHDIHEAIIRDIPTPFKHMVGKKFFEVEREIQVKLLNRLNIPYDLGDEDTKLFHQIDKAMCMVEAFLYLPDNSHELFTHNEGKDIPPTVIVACTLAHAEVMHHTVSDEAGVLSQNVIEIFKAVARLSID